MKFLWYTTELNNQNHWGGTFVSYNQASALKHLGHKVHLLDPASDFSYFVHTIKPDWIYIPIEFTRYPCYKNILHYKKIYKFGIIIGVGIFEEWTKKISGWDVLITQWYGKGVDNFPIKLNYIPHGFNPKIHFPTKQEILYDAIFIGRNQKKGRNPKKYIYKIKNVKYFGYGWPGNFETVKMDKLALLYNQAKVCPNFHGINQKSEYCMLNERTYQILACGGFQICDYVPGMEKYFTKNSLLWEKSNRNWIKKINYYINEPEERKTYIKNGLKHVQKYSYHNIMNDLINLL